MKLTSTTRRNLLKSIIPVGALASLSSVGLLSACGSGALGDKTPNDSGGGVTPPLADNVFVTTAENQAETFRHFDKIEVTRPIARSSTVRALPPSPSHDRLLANDNVLTKYMIDNRTAGVLILKDGKVALERYGMECDAQSRWTSFEITDSIMSTMMGAAVRDGYLTLEDRLTSHLPQLNGTTYETLIVTDLMRMTSGALWNDSLGQFGNVMPLHDAARQHQQGAVFNYVSQLARDGERYPSYSFDYNPSNSHILGELLRVTSGMPLTDYLSKKIWQPGGMEADASWWSETAKDGCEIGCGGINATLRDYGRFGQFVLDETHTHITLPDNWASRAYLPSWVGREYDGSASPRTGYGYLWWLIDPEDMGWPHEQPVFFARGNYGQYIFVDPVHDTVMVVLSAWREPWHSERETSLLNLVCSYLKLLDPGVS